MQTIHDDGIIDHPSGVKWEQRVPGGARYQNNNPGEEIDHGIIQQETEGNSKQRNPHL